MFNPHKQPRLDFMEQSISGPVTTDEQKRIVAAVKRRLTKIKQAIKGVFIPNTEEK